MEFVDDNTVEKSDTLECEVMNKSASADADADVDRSNITTKSTDLDSSSVDADHSVTIKKTLKSELVILKTSNSNLQSQLEEWVILVDNAIAQPNPSAARTDAILLFCRKFVPSDVTEDDIQHFSGNLSNDEVCL